MLGHSGTQAMAVPEVQLIARQQSQYQGLVVSAGVGI